MTHAARPEVLSWSKSQMASLLGTGESSVPPAVCHTAQFLGERGVWFQLARNREAYSCRDAAQKRRWLGH